MDASASNHSRRRSASSLGGLTGDGGAGHGHRRARSEQVLDPQPEQPEMENGDEDSEDSGGASSSDFELDELAAEEGLEDDEETGLTVAERRKKKMRKRGNARLDERVTSDVKVSKAEEQVATRNVIRASMINAILIGLWYLFSILISLYNKWMFSPDQLNFPFPLFTTCVHMVVQFFLASLVLYFIPQMRPGQDSTRSGSSQSDTQRVQEPHDPSKRVMTRLFYLTRIGPCGAATGLDIGLGNMSLKFITLTFYTMCKSSALGFVLMFAFLFRLEKPSWKLTAIIATMTVGVVMMVAGETAFNLFGFVLIMTSALASGFRWSLTQILLLRNPATSNPFSSIFFLAPVMFVSLLVIALPVEGVSNLVVGLNSLLSVKGTMLGTGILLFPGLIAFLMTTSEFALLKRTSVVTLSICGIFKEVVTISAASITFNDQLTPINLSGLVVTIACIGAYNYIKIRKMRDEARVNAHIANTEQYAPVLSSDPEQDAPRRTSTSRLIRHSLSIPTVLQAERPPDGSPVRSSPVKRPEDLD